MTPDRIAELLQPYIHPDLQNVDWPHVCDQLAVYLELLIKWNAKTNLTAIRNPEEIVQRHFGESILAANYIGDCETLLDFGSGAGFPGLPIQLVHPNLQVTLAESQSKKSAFLREVCRELNLPTKVFAARVETMPPTQKFDIVTLRAVDNMDVALIQTAKRSDRFIMLLTTLNATNKSSGIFSLKQQIDLPQSNSGCIVLFCPKP